MDNKIEISSDAVVFANTLRNNNIQKRHIKETITEILKRLNHELINSHREGKHYIITTLPITFDIPNMINKDTQRLIWSRIIEYLLEKRYRVWINPTNDSCKIKITWINEVDEIDIANQNNIIIKHTNKF
jgi:6-pyruvoyl-tetrahydropterin synthase